MTTTDELVARGRPCLRRSGCLVIATLAAISFVGGVPAHADVPGPPRDRAKLSDWIEAVLIEPGSGWWCPDPEGACRREHDDCALYVPCVPRWSTWAFTCAGSGTIPTRNWYHHVFGSRIECEETRRRTLGDERYASISPCTELTDARPRRPRGKGWWCYRSMFFGAESSRCTRSKSACRAARAREPQSSCTPHGSTGCLSSTFVRDLGPCRAAPEAWVHPSNDTTYFATDAHCYYDASRPRGEACRAVP